MVSAKGQRANSIQVAPNRPSFIGIDIGGTKTLGLVLGADDTVVASVKVPTAKGGNGAVQESVVALVRALMTAARKNGCPVAGIGIGAPGFVDTATGLVIDASNLGVRDLELGPAVEAVCGLPTKIIHDVRAATIAEATLGAAVGLRHFAYMNVGTGIAAGFVFDGKLYGGDGERAGEIGHVVLDPNGPICTCGKRGCLEALASGAALSSWVDAAITARPESHLARLGRSHDSMVEGRAGSLDTVDNNGGAALLPLAADAGDPDARTMINTTAAYLGQAVAWLVDSLALQRVVLGGGVVRLGSALLDPLRAVATELTLAANRTPHLIVPTNLGSEGGATGAALAARQQYASTLEVS